eukprot:517873-Prorocentrum_minimum.AAC.2
MTMSFKIQLPGAENLARLLTGISLFTGTSACRNPRFSRKTLWCPSMRSTGAFAVFQTKISECTSRKLS